MSDLLDLTVIGPAPGASALPPLHNSWLRMLTGLDDPPSEPKATCGDCIMCGGVERSGSHIAFSPDVKCCSYVPHLASFLAGRSLRGPGQDTVRSRIAGRAGVTPLGLGLSYDDLRRIVGQQSQFGRSAEVVCPHFVAETQGCAIWQTRNAVCSTWFCKHERGAVSQRFWQAVRDLLIAAEEAVSRYCLTRGGLPESQVSAVLGHRAALRETIARANAGEQIGETAPDETAGWYGQMWGDWAGREEEWFLRADDAVSAMDPVGFAGLMKDYDPLVDAVRDRWQELRSPELPDRLVLSLRPGSDRTPELLRLIGYSPFDPLVFSAALEEDLGRIDGRPLAEVREEIDTQRGPMVDRLFQLLADFEVAVPAD